MGEGGKLQFTGGFPWRLHLGISSPLWLSARHHDDLNWDSGNVDSHEGSGISCGTWGKSPKYHQFQKR